MRRGDGASWPVPHPCHANAPDVMGTDNSWGWCTQAACEWPLHLQKPNPSVKPAKGLDTFDKVLKTFLLPRHICGTNKLRNLFTIHTHRVRFRMFCRYEESRLDTFKIYPRRCLRREGVRTCGLINPQNYLWSFITWGADFQTLCHSCPFLM